jgi:predicted enzyme related to lactoylglutathione lyase
MSFYEGLLGWTYRQMDHSPLADYVMIEAGGELIGGMRQLKNQPKPSESTGPILYFTVDKLAPAMTRAKELGAHLIGETVNLGAGRGSYQWIRDREGQTIGLWAAQ